jgi:hypothetical protein
MQDGKSKYTIELLPTSGSCTAGPTAHETMLNPSSGTFRIRATGRAGTVTRSIVTTLRRQSFLDYIYFTDYETRDPAQYPDPDDAAWAAANTNVRFVVDNFRCGAGLGNLNVTGAIAQKFRGAVGRTAGSGHTGYIKNYVYDDRLKYRSPPYFLDPVQAAWKVNRSNEQVPAAG